MGRYGTIEIHDGAPNDTGPTGCRVGSVCCAAAVCSGNCIGTPCC